MSDRVVAGQTPGVAEIMNLQPATTDARHDVKRNVFRRKRLALLVSEQRLDLGQVKFQ